MSYVENKNGSFIYGLKSSIILTELLHLDGLIDASSLLSGNDTEESKNLFSLNFTERNGNEVE